MVRDPNKMVVVRGSSRNLNDIRVYSASGQLVRRLPYIPVCCD